MSIFYPQVKLRCITQLTPQLLDALEIQALVLDVDNTLTTHDDPAPQPEIAGWLAARKAEGLPMVILSNNSEERVRPFAQLLGLPFLADGKKPLASGMRRAARLLGQPPEKIGVVGDQIFTDIWGANRFGAVSILVDPLGPEKLATIRWKRRLERIVLRRYRPQPIPGGGARSDHS